MGTVALSAHQAASTRIVARRIGRQFARARRRAKDSQPAVARRVGIRRREFVSRFETGDVMNVSLGVVVRFLGLYGLTLKVVPDKPRAADARRGE